MLTSQIETIILGLIIQSIVFFITYDSPISNALRYHVVEKHLDKLSKISLFTHPVKTYVADGDSLSETAKLEPLMLKDYIELLIKCGYCLTFTLTLVVFIVNGVGFYSFLLALVNAFCYKVITK